MVQGAELTPSSLCIAEQLQCGSSGCWKGLPEVPVVDSRRADPAPRKDFSWVKLHEEARYALDGTSASTWAPSLGTQNPVARFSLLTGRECLHCDFTGTPTPSDVKHGE